MTEALPHERFVFTVGHSAHTIERFVDVLRQNGVTAVADVRSAPYSRFHPQFNRETLQASLNKHNIAYVFLGKQLGARSDDESCYENGQVQYRRLARTEAFRSGLERLRTGSKVHRIALMCAEREPLECHRTLLVSRELVAAGIDIEHIHADGHREPHAEAMTRLLQLLGLPEQDLFRSRAELIEEANARQEKRVAYVDKQLVTEAQSSANASESAGPLGATRRSRARQTVEGGISSEEMRRRLSSAPTPARGKAQAGHPRRP